ncbi:MAG: hypothetical protein ACREYF_24270, partial [Gammaproteobacteria bacterium]
MSETAEKINVEIGEQPDVEISTGRAEAARSWLKDLKKHEALEKIAIARRLGFDNEGRRRVHKFLEGENDAV